MNVSNYRVSLDIHNTASQTLIRFNQNDSARKIVFNLTEDGKPYRFTEDCSCILSAVKPDGTNLINICSVDEDNGTITYNVTQQTTSSIGTFDAQLTITGESDNVISAPIFSIEVREVVINQIDLESTSEFNALVEAYNAFSEGFEGRIADLENITSFYGDAVDAKTDAEIAKGLSEDARDDAQAWAEGKIGDAPVSSGATQYHNNAKYYAEKAADEAESITDILNDIVPSGTTSANPLVNRSMMDTSLGGKLAKPIAPITLPIGHKTSSGIEYGTMRVPMNHVAFVTDDQGNQTAALLWAGASLNNYTDYDGNTYDSSYFAVGRIPIVDDKGVLRVFDTDPNGSNSQVVNYGFVRNNYLHFWSNAHAYSQVPVVKPNANSPDPSGVEMRRADVDPVAGSIPIRDSNGKVKSEYTPIVSSQSMGGSATLSYSDDLILEASPGNGSSYLCRFGITDDPNSRPKHFKMYINTTPINSGYSAVQIITTNNGFSPINLHGDNRAISAFSRTNTGGTGQKRLQIEISPGGGFAIKEGFVSVDIVVTESLTHIFINTPGSNFTT